MASRFETVLDVPSRPGRPELRLRKTLRQDSHLLAPLIVENRDFLRPQSWTHGITTPADAQPFVDKIIEQMEADTHMQYRILEGNGIVYPRMVGTVTMHSYAPQSRLTYLGYWVAEDVAGKGYASASCRRLISYAKEVWDIDQIRLNIAPGNVNSENLAIALGASPTGNTDYEVWGDGSRQQIQVWSMPA